MSIEQENNDMLRNQIKEVAHHSSEIKKVVNKRTRVEPWVIAKTERAATDLSDVTHYLDGEKYGDGGELLNDEYKKEIIDFVKKNSYFDFEAEGDETLNFSTRQNGSVSSETASDKDITEAKSLKSKLENKFKGLDIKIDVVDEWVLLFVSEKKIIKDKYKYTFKKDFKGQGFSSSFDTMEELINRFGSWIDVNWSNIKKEANNITDYPNDTFTGWMESKPMILKRAEDKDNTMGYNFYLIKSKKKNLSYKDGGWVLYDQDTEKLVKIFDTESEARESMYYYPGNANIVEKSAWDNSDGGSMYAEGGGVGREETQENNFGIRYKLGDKFLLNDMMSSKSPIETSIVEILPSGLFFKVDKSNKVFSIKTLHSKGASYTSGQYLIVNKKMSDGGSMYAGGGKVVGSDVYAYFDNNYMGYQLVESPALGEPYDGKITDIITENGKKKYVIKFENGETKKISESIFDDYIYLQKMTNGGSMYAEGGEVSFTDYKGESIMFEPHFNEYYVGDAGPFSTMDEAKAHIDGGSQMSSSMRGAYERGLFAEGGEIKVGDEFLNTERGEKFYIDKIDLSDKSYPFYVLKSSPNDLPEVIGRNEFDRYYKAGLYEKFNEGGSMYAEGSEVSTIKILKDSFQQRADQPNRVYHSVEGMYGDYWFTAKTDNSHKSGYGSNGINDGCVYQLNVWRGGNPVGRDSSTKGGHVSEDFLAGYDNKWDNRPRTKEAKEVVSVIVEWLEKNICDLKREWSSVKFNEGGQLEKGAINYLGDLWFAIQESRVDEYPKLAEALDKLHVSFRVQNAVSSDAQEMRGRKAISTEEAQQRIRKILSENGITKYSGGGSITKEEYIQLLSKYDKLGAFLEDALEDADNESEIKRLKSEMDEVESKIISFERNKMATGGGVSSENAEKIAKLEKVLSSTLVPDSVKEKARMEIERLKSEATASDSRLSAEQRDLNKKAIAIVDKAKITNFEALVSEALTDANYHSSAFKFAQLVDSSIKTKEDWYKADAFSGDDKTTDAGIQIANMCGWDGDKITETLYFVLKMKSQQKLADALKKAMEVEEASYPNAITELTKRQTEYTQEIANRTGLRQSAIAEFVAKNGLTETETLNLVQGLGMGKLKPRDFQAGVLGVDNNDWEKQIVAFAKSNEAFKSEEPKSIRTAVELETKPSIRTAVVEVEKEQPKVSDDRLKGKNISDVSKYVPHRNIESITFTIDGKSYTVKGSDIFDGIYVENNAIGIKAKRATKAKQPKVTRTQFEEETFEFAQGGYTRPTGKVSGIYDFAVKDGITNLKVVGFERQNDTEDSLYFDDSEKSSKTKFGSILVKNNAMSKLTKGKTVMAVSSTGIRGKLTRVKDLF